MSLNLIKHRVKAILEKYYRTRNDDNELFFRYLCDYYPGAIQFLRGRHYICIEYLQDNNVSFESVIRVRRLVQEQINYLCPTDWEVARGRRFKRDEWEGFIKLQKPEKQGCFI